MTSERVYCSELAQFLHVHTHKVTTLAKRWGLLRRKYVRPGGIWVSWVSPYGAQRVIAYIRAIQGDMYDRGYNLHHEKDRNRAWLQKRLANSRADTEAEAAKRDHRRPTAESGETAVVCIEDGLGSPGVTGSS